MSEGIGGSTGSSSQTTNVNIPDFLQPFLNQATGTAGNALSSLVGLGGQDLVADLTPDQQQAIGLAQGIAGGEGGFIPTAQEQTLATAQGQPISSFLDPNTLAALQGFGAPVEEFLPQASLDALTSTAQGDFLAGGQGFDAAVDAALRAARPQILSTFGGAGAGGATGGLAQTAIGTAAVDAFARQFGDERNRQLRAANTLGGFTSGERNRGLSSQGLLAGLSGDERNRQVSAVNNLANVGLLPSNIFQGTGGQLQNQAQNEISGPIDFNAMLLQAALSGLPIPALLGQSSEGDFTQFGFGHQFG